MPELLILLAAALALFTASAWSLSLPALDDCFYAQKAVEMAESGGFFTVTWNGQPAFQNPPLQIWLTARSIALFGENDFAVRLPSIVMAVGILLGVYHLGVRLLDRERAASAIAWLLVTPLFVVNARRSMMEIPLTFWTVLALVVFVEGLRRPLWHALLALPLGAAVLTKSVLGVLPLLLIVAAAALCPPLRAPFRQRWIWLGILAGLAIGASWSIHQLRTFGDDAIHAHFVGEVLSRSAAASSTTEALFAYPRILLSSFHPVVLPGIAGVVLLLRRWWTTRTTAAVLLVVAAVLPPLLYSASAARSGRYVFPILPALALCAAACSGTYAARIDRWFRRFLAPAAGVGAALVLWLHPSGLKAERHTAPFKAQATTVASSVPPAERIPYAGARYWTIANPLLYYSDRRLALPSATMAQAVLIACEGSHVLAADTERLTEIEGLGVVPRTLLAAPEVSLVVLDGCRTAKPALHRRVARELAPAAAD